MVGQPEEVGGGGPPPRMAVASLVYWKAAIDQKGPPMAHATPVAVDGSPPRHNAMNPGLFGLFSDAAAKWPANPAVVDGGVGVCADVWL